MLKMPKAVLKDETKKFEKLFKSYDYKQIRGWLISDLTIELEGVNYNLRHYGDKIAFVYLFNNMADEYQGILDVLFKTKAITKGTFNSNMLRYSLMENMDLTIIEKFWNERSVRLDDNTLKILDSKCSDETIKWFDATPKFLKHLFTFSKSERVSILDLKKPIWKTLPNFLSYIFKIYEETGEFEELLPKEVQDIFLF